MQHTGEQKRARVLDPVERVTEVIFGLLMAMTFTGTISVATSGQEAERTMMFAALGCNLAWGLADAVMYLLRTLIEHTRNRTLRTNLCGATDAATGQALIADALPPRIAAVVGQTSWNRCAAEWSSTHRCRYSRASAGTTSREPSAFSCWWCAQHSRSWCRFCYSIRRHWRYACLTWSASVVLFAAGWVLAKYAGAKPW